MAVKQAPAVVPGQSKPNTVIKKSPSFLGSTRKPITDVQDSTTMAFGGSNYSVKLANETGYASAIWINVTATGGAGASVAGQLDAPFNFINSINLSGPMTKGIWNMSGYSLYLINKYGDLLGIGGSSDPMLMPSYSPIDPSTGDFRFSLRIPFEYIRGEGLVSWSNAQSQVKLNVTPNTSGDVYSTAPTTLPTVTATFDIEYYPVPNSLVMPTNWGNLITCIEGQLTQNFGGGTSTKISGTPFGGKLTGLIMVTRASGTNVRTEAWPSGLNRTSINIDSDIADNITTTNKRLLPHTQSH